VKIRNVEANGRAHLGQRHPVGHRAHGVLADAEVKVPAGVAADLEVPGAAEGEPRLGGGKQVGGTA
jgi:hypothetical protein